MTIPLLSLPVRKKRDIVLARQRARQIAGLLGFDSIQQMAFATAVFEIARAALETSRRGVLQFQLNGDRFQVFCREDGASSNPQVRPKAGYRTSPAKGGSKRKWNLAGARRLLDRLRRETGPKTEGSSDLDRLLPEFPLTLAREDLPFIVAELDRLTPLDLFEEFHLQNQELSRVLRDLDPQKQVPSLFAPAPESPAA